ncbi:MAG: hypothetical protein WAN65_20645 [Candidatus Sulfotelmatobacter sp.]
MKKPKPVRGWRTYRSVAGKVVKAVEISNDEIPAVIIYFRDDTQLYVGVQHPIEFQVRLEKLTRDDILILHAYPLYKKVRR